MTPHTLPLWASYGVSFMSYTKKNDRDIYYNMTARIFGAKL